MTKECLLVSGQTLVAAVDEELIDGPGQPRSGPPMTATTNGSRAELVDRESLPDERKAAAAGRSLGRILTTVVIIIVIISQSHLGAERRQKRRELLAVFLNSRAGHTQNSHHQDHQQVLEAYTSHFS